MEKKRGSRDRWLWVLLWAIFLAGVAVQWFAPRLKIENNAFVIPPTLTSNAREGIRPDQIVARERRLQLLSAILTVGGALGLGLWYRRDFVRSHSSDAT